MGFSFPIALELLQSPLKVLPTLSPEIFNHYKSTCDVLPSSVPVLMFQFNCFFKHQHFTFEREASLSSPRLLCFSRIVLPQGRRHKDTNLSLLLTTHYLLASQSHIHSLTHTDIHTTTSYYANHNLTHTQINCIDFRISCSGREDVLSEWN